MRPSRQAQIRVVDFGSQYTQLIARRIREMGVYAEIVSCHAPWEVLTAGLAEGTLRGLIFSGGPQSVYQPGAPTVRPEVYQAGVPILGICYGLQLMAHQLGGQVVPGPVREYGPARLEVLTPDVLFQGLPPAFQVWMSHGDRVERLPPGFQALARTEATPYAAFADPRRRLYGVQFHPEVVHTAHGRDILARFVFDVCGAVRDWDLAAYMRELIAWVQARSREGDILVAVSGGVDSTVLARLVHEAAGDRMLAVFVNNGLLRQGEPEAVQANLRDRMGIPLHYVDASEVFLERLRGVTDPEQKRRIIGDTFVDVFVQVTRSIRPFRFFAQGTLYPDVVESGASLGPSAVIKTHHNLVEAVRSMGMEVLEPFRELFKDEVRQMARLLGIPDDIVHRQPFPGPGLAVRILGEVTPERLAILRAADAIVEAEVRRSGWYERLWQSFAVLVPVRTVGVMGDERSYAHVIALRVVESQDGMTADWVYLPEDLLRRLAARIVNEVRGVGRVVLDVTSKPPATIEWE
ncbi:GMP synthase [glutamine-hydrolyzing] [bacterium HR11]|nr:GMP synthase [glutamine-hydrolyzing] [bacterium HR11]